LSISTMMPADIQGQPEQKRINENVFDLTACVVKKVCNLVR